MKPDAANLREVWLVEAGQYDMASVMAAFADEERAYEWARDHLGDARRGDTWRVFEVEFHA